jgi:hypothetical protein
MEADHDLRKFITETAVAQRRGMLSSGREASGAVRLTAGGRAAHGGLGDGGGRAGRGSGNNQIHNVGRLTPGAGVGSSTAMGSDLWAAEALQVAETEVGVGND